MLLQGLTSAPAGLAAHAGSSLGLRPARPWFVVADATRNLPAVLVAAWENGDRAWVIPALRAFVGWRQSVYSPIPDAYREETLKVMDLCELDFRAAVR